MMMFQSALDKAKGKLTHFDGSMTWTLLGIPASENNE